MSRFDAAVIGAGAAGLFCAGIAAQQGARVVLIDHAERLAEKIRISGGGRCNFTNLDGGRDDRYLGVQPRFARHALRAFGPDRFIAMVRDHGIAFHEKHRGQLFCDRSSEDIIDLLVAGCDRGGVEWRRPCALRGVRREDDGFVLATDAGSIGASRLVVATGGLSIPKIGATDLGYRIARQFDLAVVEPRPALVPMTFDADRWAPFAALSGLSVPCRITVAAREDRRPEGRDAGDASDRPPVFDEDLLFTHRGLSGPAALQISGYWRPGRSLAIDLAAGDDLAATLIAVRDGSRQPVERALATRLPRRLAETWLATSPQAGLAGRRLAEIGTADLRAIARSLADWRVRPDGTEGYRKAEVTAGGVATTGLDPRTMQADRVPGLYFIGEVVDVTGWLGGYNFQWAWSSAWAAANAISEAVRARSTPP